MCVVRGEPCLMRAKYAARKQNHHWKNTQCRAKQFTSFIGATSVHVLCGCMHYIRPCIRVCILLPKFIRKPRTPAWVMRNQKLICAKCSDSRAEAISPACVRVVVKERVCWSWECVWREKWVRHERERDGREMKERERERERARERERERNVWVGGRKMCVCAHSC